MKRSDKMIVRPFLLSSGYSTMSLLNTPKGLRLHIGLFGKRNAGKSSLINALTNQTISIVSDVAGTTTDPVEKACEFLPLGPVVFIDTAGIDDVGDLGRARVKRSLSVLEWVDMALIVTTPSTFGEDEKNLINRVRALDIPAILVVNRIDEVAKSTDTIPQTDLPVVHTSAQKRTGLDELRALMVQLAKDRVAPDRPLIGDLAGPGDTVILVTPIDTGAPKGRLILPQVQAIRELLDAHAKCFVVQEDRVAETIAELRRPPRLVMADSQVIKTVNEQTPVDIPLTTFSTQMAYSKSDIVEMARGAAALSQLSNGDRVLIGETCSHHPQKDDIGRVKIPRWLRERSGKDLHIDIAVGKDFPEDLTPYRIVIQCGGCVVTRQHMLARLRQAHEQGVPMTNYGLTISYLQGVLERILSCHPEALQAYRNALQEGRNAS